MARKNAVVEPEVEETQVEETNESAESTTEEVDLTAFQEAAQAAAEGADESTGQPTAEGIEAMNEEYRKLPVGKDGRIAAKDWLFEQVKFYLDKADIIKARPFVVLNESASAAKGRKSSEPKAPANPTEAFVQKIAALTLAWNLARDEFVPENVDEDWSDKVDALVESEETTNAMTAYAEYEALDAEEKADANAPEVPGFVKQAYKLASTKVLRRTSGGGSRPASVYSGPARSVLKHMEEVFADLEPGTFLKVSEIAKTKSSEYGDDNPSSGAVNARLFPSREGAEPLEAETFKAATDDDGHKGAIRL